MQNIEENTTETNRVAPALQRGAENGFSGKDMAALNTATESAGDLIFSLCDRQDRLFGRLGKKVTRLEKRVSVLEERGRP
ncbi:MAG: hypothetical protein A4E35_01949 [Methanoregula sp. PtaU1.Bin051]|nr:MAG: hypothetical protein A4E35_01949 [Methanoregula sp. PtaU1.Bin051]